MPLQLTFRDDVVREMCECSAVAERALGSHAAKRLRARLSDICAADSILEVVAGSPKFLARGEIVFTLYPPHKMVLEAAMTRLPKNDKGEVDWNVVDTYRVVRVD